MYETNKYEGMIAETVGIKGYNGDTVFTTTQNLAQWCTMILIYHAISEHI